MQQVSFRLDFLSMTKQKRFLIGGLVLGGGFTLAANFGEKPDTPQLPGLLWLVADGILTAADKSLASKDHFRDIQMHIEWRIPADRQVDGQKGGNSGIFLMGLYEVQVLA